ncbi:hypothetical protein CsSME_00034222 [Camellia sinensis var. sinensis]
MMRDMPHNGEKEGRQGRVNIWQSGLEDSKSGQLQWQLWCRRRKRRRLLLAAADDDDASTSPQHIHQIPSPISNVPTEPTVQPTPPPPEASQQTSLQPASQSSPQQSTQSASQHPSTSPQHIVPSVSSPQPSPSNPSNSQTSNKESQRIEFDISINSQSSPTDDNTKSPEQKFTTTKNQRNTLKALMLPSHQYQKQLVLMRQPQLNKANRLRARYICLMLKLNKP